MNVYALNFATEVIGVGGFSEFFKTSNSSQRHSGFPYYFDRNNHQYQVDFMRTLLF